MSLFRRRNDVVVRRKDGLFDIVLAPDVRIVIDEALGQVDDLLDDPDSPLVARLRPPAYEDDPELDLGYQLLAGEELRTARREAIATVHRIHQSSLATDDDLWAWLRALNALRLVLGTALGIDDDEYEPPEFDEDDPEAPVWGVYELTSEVQHHVIRALEGD